MKKRFGKSDEDAIVTAYKAGATLLQLAIAHGVYPSTIRDTLIRQGVPRRKRGPINAQDGQLTNHKPIIDTYASGLSLEETGKAFGITRERVRQILNRNGVTYRHYASKNPSRRNERNQAIVSEYQAGAEIAHLASKYHLYINYVRTILRRHGVELRARIWPESSTKDRDTEIVRAFLGGATIAALAAQYGFSSTYVATLLYRNGARRRRPASGKIERNAVIVTAFQDGKTKSEIARAYGLSYARVSNIISHVLSENSSDDTA